MREKADVIFENARVLTCEPGQPTAEAVAVRGDRICCIGTNNFAAELKQTGTRVIDCQGKTLIPGFIDAHGHFFSLVRQLLSLDLSPAAVHSIQDIRDTIQRKAHFIPTGTWISGSAYNEFYLKEKRHPTRRDLDEAALAHPVIIVHRSSHACVLNSLALNIVGINIETEEPPGGWIERDLETGEPNGILIEMLDYVKSRIPSPVSEAEMDWGIAEANRQYLSAGITSFGEASFTNDVPEWETFRKLKEAGKIAPRINMMAGGAFLPEFVAAGMATGAGDTQLKLGSLKIVLSAAGELNPPQAELNRLMLEAARAGFQVAVHAVERQAVEAAAAALEYVRDNLPPRDRRLRIEHCSECPPELSQRLGNLRAIVVSQPSFLYYHGERYLATVDPETQKWLYPFKSLINAGVRLAGSSDSPVVPNNPLIGMYAAVNRLAQNGQPILGGEVISARQALEMYTINAAAATFEERVKGSLAPGKLADLVMLSDSPFMVPPEELKDIQVEMTVIGGTPHFSKPKRVCYNLDN
ncbi:MAG TPA: amidohydrolase [Dehalococcoidales bacterium]